METGLMIAAMVLVAIIFTAVGIHIGKTKVTRQYVQGILNIDTGDLKNSPGLFLSLDVPIEDVASRKQAVFTVNVIR